MTSKRSYRDNARARLLDLWQSRLEFGDPVGCLSSTFTFEGAFYEEECLARFVGLESNAREDGQIYLVEREERLSQVTSAVFVDRGNVVRDRSLRWNLLPVRVPRGGILHAKVHLLVWRELVRVLVGSANLTESGYRTNREQVAVFDFRPGGDIPLGFLEDVLAFFRELLTRTPGSASVGPRRSVEALLRHVQDTVSGWPPVERPNRDVTVSFVSVLPGRPGLLEQIENIWKGTGPDWAQVVSPFYSEEPDASVVLDRLISIMAKRGEREVGFVARGERLPDQSAQIYLPESYRTRTPSRVTPRFSIIDVAAPTKDESGEEAIRLLHAKCIWFERGSQALFSLGSSNFTAAGLGIGSGPVNVEANVVYAFRDTESRIAKIAWMAVPGGVELEADSLAFQSTESSTQEAEGYSPLPASFGEALFEPSREGTGILRLEIGPDAPVGFAILHQRGDEHDVVLTHSSWKNLDASQCEVEWSRERPPSSLLVQWTSRGEDKRAVWPVNVTDGSLLPPPDELRKLELGEILQILTSARPLHEIMRKILRRKERSGGGANDIVVDPHKKVDTSAFLMRRMRRMATALEGLRARLQRPAYSIEGLRWRLQGPIGPIAVARRLAEEEKHGSAFMIAEVLLTLSQVDWEPAKAELGLEVVAQEIEDVKSILKRLSEAAEPETNLAEYVRAVFEAVDR